MNRILQALHVVLRMLPSKVRIAVTQDNPLLAATVRPDIGGDFLPGRGVRNQRTDGVGSKIKPEGKAAAHLSCPAVTDPMTVPPAATNRTPPADPAGTPPRIPREGKRHRPRPPASSRNPPHHPARPGRTVRRWPCPFGVRLRATSRSNAAPKFVTHPVDVEAPLQQPVQFRVGCRFPFLFETLVG